MPGGYFLAGRTSQNPVKRKPNFRELRYGEVRRINLPRTRVNRGQDNGRSDETLDIAAVTHLTALTEPKPLGAVSMECRYPVVALALKEILKEQADVYEGSRQ